MLSVLTYALNKTSAPLITVEPTMPRVEAISVPRDILTMSRRPLCSLRRGAPREEVRHHVPLPARHRVSRKGEVVKLLPTQTKGKRERRMYADLDNHPALRDMRALVATDQLPRAYRTGRVLHKALVGCGYQDLNVVVHSLPHTYGTRLLEEGVPPPIVEKIMGHKHIETTMRYYHASDAAAERAIHEPLAAWKR